MDASREHAEGPGSEGQGAPRRLVQRDPDVQTSTSAGAFDTTGSGVAPKTGDYTAGGGGGGGAGGCGGCGGSGALGPRPRRGAPRPLTHPLLAASCRRGDVAPGDVHRAALAPSRGAGGSAEEVAAANPGVAKAVPSSVGRPHGGGVRDEAGAGLEAAAGGGGPPLELWDGSGMEVPELAVQRGWRGGD
jgi:hypothetical protein